MSAYGPKKPAVDRKSATGTSLAQIKATVKAKAVGGGMSSTAPHKGERVSPGRRRSFAERRQRAKIAIDHGFRNLVVGLFAAGGALERKDVKEVKPKEQKKPLAEAPDLNKLVDAAIALVQKGASSDLEAKLTEIRKAILIFGIPDTSNSSDGLRCKTYKLLLGVDRVDADEYLQMVEKKQSEKYTKTKDDAFRTFKGDEVARARITDAQLVRFLNAFTHRYTPSFTYLQVRLPCVCVCLRSLLRSACLHASLFWFTRRA